MGPWFGPEVGSATIDRSVPLAIFFAIPIMILIGFVLERGLIERSARTTRFGRESFPTASVVPPPNNHAEQACAHWRRNW